MTIAPLSPEFMMLGSDPTLLRDELKSAIQAMCDGNPRSMQVEIGASEIGTPCIRQLVYKLGQVPQANPDSGTWRQQVGTLIHGGLAEMLEAWNQRLIHAGEYPRWYIEQEVVVGTFGNGRILKGHGDAYDRTTAAVVDWKSLGVTSLKKMKRDDHPGQQYEVQVQCYGLGFQQLGLPVDSVHIFSLPQSGELSDVWHWSAPYDPHVAWNALNRAHQLVIAGETMGFGRLAALAATRENYCESCPWFAPWNSDPENGRCPGADRIQAQRAARAHAVPPRPFG